MKPCGTHRFLTNRHNSFTIPVTHKVILKKQYNYEKRNGHKVSIEEKKTLNNEAYRVEIGKISLLEVDAFNDE